MGTLLKKLELCYNNRIYTHFTMNAVPEDNTLYEMFEEQANNMLSESLLPHFDDDIHDLVDDVKKVIHLTLSKNPEASVDAKKQVGFKLELWRKSKVKHLAYARYRKYIQANQLTTKVMNFSDFANKHYYQKWILLEKLGLKKGSRIRVKGYGDEYTVRGVSAHISIGVEEIGKHFNPDQIVSVEEL